MTDEARDVPERPPFPAERIEAILAEVDAGRADAPSAFFTILWAVLGIESHRAVYMERLDDVRAFMEDLRVGRISGAEAWERMQDVAEVAYVYDSGGMLPEADPIREETVEAILADLDGREQRVMRLRFGLHDGHAWTLEEVGREFGVSRYRIRQIEASALRKLRHPSRSRNLKDYLE